MVTWRLAEQLYHSPIKTTSSAVAERLHNASKIIQGDHSPDNVKFSDNSMTFPWRFTALLPHGVFHIMPVQVLLSVVRIGLQQCMIQNQNEMHSSAKSRTDANMQLTINSFRSLPWQDFSLTLPWLSLQYLILTFRWQLSNSLTFPGFFRQVVILFTKSLKITKSLKMAPFDSLGSGHSFPFAFGNKQWSYLVFVSTQWI